MNTIPDMLASTVRDNSERLAVVDKDVAVSYSELERRITSMAAELRDRGADQGDRVGLLLPNSLDFVVSYFSILALGAIVVPLNDHYQESELLYFLDTCGVSLLVTARSFEPLCKKVLGLREAPCTLFFVDEQTLDAVQRPTSFMDFGVAIDPDSPVMYQFSSGSTGRPKRIARSHAKLVFELNSLARTLSLTNEDRFVGVAPFSHVNGLTRSMMASMRAGATLYPLPKFERQAVADLVQNQQISMFIAVPFMFSVLAQSNFRRQPGFSSLRLAVSASAPMPTKFNQMFRDRFGIYVRQLYGSTETGTISVNLSPTPDTSLDSVGTPIAGVEVDLFTDDGRAAQMGEMGECAVKSPAAITGYEDLPEVNKEAFRDGYFFTGDLGRRDAEGALYLIGRKKFFINKGGYKIDPRSIEELLEEHPKVDEVVVLGVPTPYEDERVKAVIVPNGPCTQEEILDHCRGKIADFKIPSVIEFRDSLPKSPTGKTPRGMLLK